MEKAHYEYLDRLKGFAILTVIMGHFIFFALGIQDMLLEIIGTFHMTLLLSSVSI